ncbi:MAG: hypothetical protein KIT16_23445 [Rhodospirillaceae bacterium]|nr:hypothetical protein [Rhodospirillaceae bacterium]
MQPAPAPAPNPATTPQLARRLAEIAAAGAGVAAGVAFAEPVLAALGRAWHGFILPAYQAVIENGIFSFCM